MAELDNILNSDDQLNEEQLRKYISGNADADDIHAVEKSMIDDEFVSDAVEGLQDFSSNVKLDDYVNQLNKKLHQQLEAPKERKKKRDIKDLSWIIVAAIIILLLCVIAAWIIRIQKEKENKRKITDVTVVVTKAKDNISNV